MKVWKVDSDKFCITEEEKNSNYCGINEFDDRTTAIRYLKGKIENHHDMAERKVEHTRKVLKEDIAYAQKIHDAIVKFDCLYPEQELILKKEES